VAVLLAAAMLAGGATLAKKRVEEPDHLDPDFTPDAVDTLFVPSAVDIRKDKAIEFKDLDAMLEQSMKSAFRKSVYRVEQGSGFGAFDRVTEDDLEYLDESWIRDLGADGHRWVLLLALEDLAKKKTFGGAFGAQCSGYLFDTSEGRAVWRHSTVASMGQGGLLGMSLKKAIRNDTVRMCFVKVVQTLPGQFVKKKDRKTGKE
jgi:hypothetical protein